MKKTVLSSLLIVLLCALVVKPAIPPQTLSAAPQAAVPDRTDSEIYYTETPESHIAQLGNAIGYADNELIVYFKDGATEKQKQALFTSLGAEVIGHTEIMNKYQLRLPETKTYAGLLALCAKTKLNPKVSFASCNMAMQRKEDVVPDDPWNNPEIGDFYYTPDWDEKNVSGRNWWLTAIQAPSAWEHQELFQHMCIGIIDSGFETEHEDLQGKISFPNKSQEKKNIPGSHGTHVAGIISANANNGVGVTGICDNADLLCVDWEPDAEVGQKWSTDERIFTGFISLVIHGAKVINLSLGSSHNYDPEAKDNWKWKFGIFFEGLAYSYAMAALLNLGYDFVVVQSAGNGDANGDPCDSIYNGSFCSINKTNAFTGFGRAKKQDVLNRLIIVGSCTPSHDEDVFYQSAYSNYGERVSIFAPGSSVYSTILISEDNYGYKSGTSMAAPNVTGVAALTWSVNPKLTGAEIKQILCDPANTIYTARNYYNDTMDIPDYRMVNAKLSVEAAMRTIGLEPEPSTDEPTTDGLDEPSVVAEENKPFLTGRSDQKTIESYRGEIGE
jgi:subtilisin family serine protease